MRVSVVPSCLGVGRAGRCSGCGRCVAAGRDVCVEVAVFDAAGGAGAGHELELDPEVAGAVAHGGRGERALAGGVRVVKASATALARSLGRRCGRGRLRRWEPGRLQPSAQGSRRGRSRRLIALALDIERHQRSADGELLAGFAVQGDDGPGDGGGQFDRGLVGHDLGEELVLGDRVADLDVPADEFGLGGAFADVGQFEDEIAAGGWSPLHQGRGAASTLGRLRLSAPERVQPWRAPGRPRRTRVPRPLDLELHQRRADGQLLAGFAVGGEHLAGDGRGQFDRRLVGHDVGDDLVLGDHVADLDVPGDQFGLGGAFAHVGQFEDVAAHPSALRS